MELSRKSAAIMLPGPVDAYCFTSFDTALLLLKAVQGLEFGNTLWDSTLFADHVKEFSFKKNMVKSQFQIFPMPFTAESCQIQFLRALDFMTNLTVSDGHAKFQLMSLISKECFLKALQCGDSQFKPFSSAALTYLAALYFASSENQIVIDLCSAVLMDQTIDMNHEALNAGCLLFIKDVAIIVGFCLAWKMLNENRHYTKGPIYLDLRLTPKVLSYYLAVISAVRVSTRLELNPDLPTSALPLDQFFMLLATQRLCSSMAPGMLHKGVKQCVYRRMDSFRKIAPLSLNSSIMTEKLIDALTEYALENIASYYIDIGKDFGIHRNTADCYKALYLYKCRRYDEVLNLCEQILEEPIRQSSFLELAWANVLLMPLLSSFFDADVQSLLGFQTLCNKLSHVNNDMQKDLSCLATFGLESFSKENEIHDPLPGQFLMMHYYCLGSHFLAKYLTLRSFVDCNRPILCAMSEFVAMKFNLPFERIIRRFYLRKLRNFKN